MRILFVSRFFPYVGGREAVVLLLAEELSKTHEVAVLTPDLGRASEKYLIYHYNNKNIQKILKSFRPDIISSHTFYLTPQIISANNKNVPVVLTLHGDLLNFGSNEDKKMFLDMVSSLDKIIVVCTHGYKQLNTKGKIKESKLSLIRCGIDTDIFQPRFLDKKQLRKALRLPENKFLFVTPARMTGYKGIEFLLSSLKKIKNYKDKIHFLIATPPSRYRESEIEYTKKILQMAKAYNLSDLFTVGFYDFISIPLLYNSGDVLILPSMTEQLPISILEAQASGLPIIATNVGGVKEIISDGKTGYLIKYGDTNALAQSILDIFGNSKKYRAISQRNVNFVTPDYSKERMIKEYLDLFQLLIEKNSYVCRK
ncbi:hypothetical protein COT64_02060 [Candidatus Shapirobacteria bacterium CG09_land_8_20_14_0_10_39_12]|uniref:Glycosyltransferase family 1 protein n=1 Tax=Candidatus Shapirobacteria bacterium CG09_land_8_20_14_0_10_39_12 TaxID=1974885 RepID=A0A2H0WPI5_9BACT|nr:MAG: hypothetical protein COT64_02060 [Candidatus Shapirobacteria bacterium CG09_land_8_20_14_0_10_39_12]